MPGSAEQAAPSEPGPHGVAIRIVMGDDGDPPRTSEQVAECFDLIGGK